MVYAYHVVFIHSPVDGHVGRSHVSAAVKSVAIQVTSVHLTLLSSLLSSVTVFRLSCLFKISTLFGNTHQLFCQMCLKLVCFFGQKYGSSNIGSSGGPLIRHGDVLLLVMLTLGTE